MARADRPPSFQFYPRDFRADADVQSMTFDQRGRYIWALCASWDTESPGAASEDQWRRWMHYSPAEWVENRETMSCAFSIDGDTWLQERMIQERLRQYARYVQAQSGARIANAKRTLSVRTASAQRTDSVRTAPTPSSASAVASSSAIPLEPEPTLSSPAATRAPEPASFAAFWDAYPRKVGRKAAVAAYQRAIKGGADSESILAAVVAQRASSAWTKDGGQFIPHPTTWLNQGRWDDDTRHQGGSPRSQSDAEYAALNRIGE